MEVHAVAVVTYERRKQIGVGQGMNSTVYLADDPQLGATIAVKEISKANFGNTVAGYFAEAQAMFETQHPNVVAIRYACELPDDICLAMPYYKNGSLADRIGDRPLALSEVLRVARGVLAGLARIHATNYVHFDVKPSNVLFSDKDVPMVADFGQSRAISATGVVTVPDLYENALPPEVLNGGVGSILADIYQMGLLLYRAVNGDQMYQAQVVPDQGVMQERIAKGKFPDRRRFMPHVPKRLRTIIRTALCVDATKRYQSATEMTDALNRMPLKTNWTVKPLPGGGTRWRAARAGRAKLIVELTPNGQDWCVETFTKGAEKRALGKAANWRAALSKSAAAAHLKDVFERLQE